MSSSEQIPLSSAFAPEVKLDNATVIGNSNGNYSEFLGIRYAAPAVRFSLPQQHPAYNGTVNATVFGSPCSQQNYTWPTPVNDDQRHIQNFLQTSIPTFTGSEDCLNLNVFVPASATPSSRLPVVVWFPGGGFQTGAAQANKGESVVLRSVAIGRPVIWVGVNYRLSAFGFLASEEVRNAKLGNLGLQDQRQALRWVSQYIANFGGDPSSVTLWGESAGAMSIALQMIAFNANTENLFRGAIMQSGAPLPVGDITHGQKYYNDLVRATGCQNANDTLTCLRNADYNILKAAVDASPSFLSFQSLNLAWVPRVDGVVLTDEPMQLVADGIMAKIPFISGNCDDEGTLFSLSSTNISQEAILRAWIHQNYLPNATTSDITNLFGNYTNDPRQGSPFDTGDHNQLTPVWKQAAAIQGDMVFQAPRRFFMQSALNYGNHKIWGFLSKRFKDEAVQYLRFMGSMHGTDLRNAYDLGGKVGGELLDYVICFVNTLDPQNGCGQLRREWPAYDSSASRPMLEFTTVSGLPELSATTDDYRQGPIDLLISLMIRYPLLPGPPKERIN
ncbi:carotenoid ester lipase [Punctularia strigosozonata HHB-11173 SS5]|uniref:carotenoid ester lipase n=1 Tax=Punctularia strigosozonata (strain HHB-11173) TaxID=741275 RepID=UPI000441766E|nr:carotenoid ester lipase [Punctularia strigosozonata HHB-11173 SS5]EIN08884.1 carotenoid ester lipase [Punctularia strigosozonata HHB-11173 SS5]